MRALLALASCLLAAGVFAAPAATPALVADATLSAPAATLPAPAAQLAPATRLADPVAPAAPAPAPALPAAPAHMRAQPAAGAANGKPVQSTPYPTTLCYADTDHSLTFDPSRDRPLEGLYMGAHPCDRVRPGDVRVVSGLGLPGSRVGALDPDGGQPATLLLAARAAIADPRLDLCFVDSDGSGTFNPSLEHPDEALYATALGCDLVHEGDERVIQGFGEPGSSVRATNSDFGDLDRLLWPGYGLP
jgi:hypothetical protein